MTQEIRLDVIAVRQPIGEFYVASMTARDLVSISYSDVRRLVNEDRDIERYLGIQRPLSKSRVKDIRRYISGKDATFPTSVIVAVDERCIEFAEDDQHCGMVLLRSFPGDDDAGEDEIPFEMMAKVIDGQHRIAAFMNDNGEYSYEGDDDFELNVVIFVGADVSEQANVFATVNLAQTKVNKSLVYDLTGLAETPSPQKTCHNVAVALDSESSSPLFQRIKRLGTATPGRKYEPLTQAGFVESLLPFVSSDPVGDRIALLDGQTLKKASGFELGKRPFRNLFVSGREVDIAEILYNYFTAVRKKWPKSWDAPKESGNLLPRSNAFKALMKYLREDVYPDIVGDRYGLIPSAKEFSPYFKDISVEDEDFRAKNFVPGSGGQSTFLKILRGEISRQELIQK